MSSVPATVVWTHWAGERMAAPLLTLHHDSDSRRLFRGETASGRINDELAIPATMNGCAIGSQREWQHDQTTRRADGGVLMKAAMLLSLFTLLTGCGGPSTSADYADLAGEQFNDEQFAKAIDSCSEAIALDPSNVDAYMLCGSSCHLVGRHNDGLSDLDEAIALSPNRADLYLYRSQIHTALGETAKADDDRDRALSLDPDLLRR